MALILTLILMALLLFMITALLTNARGQSFFTRGELDQTRALYIAEAGAADAIARFESLHTWDEDLIDESMPNGQGSYSIRFGPQNSVNNLTGTAEVPGPRGPVAPGTAFLVVDAQIGMMSRRLEAVIAPRIQESSRLAISASGRIRMKGRVRIDGVQDLVDYAPISADIASNSNLNQAGIISWDPLEPSDRAAITGAARTVSGHSQAIQFNGSHQVDDGLLTNEARTPVPNIDVLGEISAGVGSPAPVINSFGTTTLSNGDYYLNGDLVADGDIVLDNARLFVDGRLDINGSLGGDGSIYVAEDSSFYGDAEVTGGTNKVALYSKGDVSLLGFDGVRYMDNLVGPFNPSNPNNPAGDWEQSKRVTTRMLEIANGIDPTGSGGEFYEISELDLLGHALVTNLPAPGPTHWNTGNSLGVFQTLPRLRDLLITQPSGPSRQFMIEKISWMVDGNNPLFPDRGLFGWHHTDQERDSTISGFDATGNLNKLYDSINDRGRYDKLGAFRYLVSQISYDRLGSAYFKGAIYSNGSFYADSQVVIVGSVVAYDDGSQAPRFPDPNDTTLQVNPGDVFLNNGSQITFVQDLHKSTIFPLDDLAIRVWMGQ